MLNAVSIVCPSCGWGDCAQIHRNKLEKWLIKKNKYQCKRCGKKFYAKEQTIKY